MQNLPATAPTAAKRRRWPIAVGIAAAFGIGAIVGSSGGSTGSTPVAAPATATVTAPVAAPATVTVTVTAEPPAPAPAPAPAGPATSAGSGTYHVGTDIKAGRYRTSGPGAGGVGMCGWSRNRNDSGDFSAIITNGIVQGPTSVTVNTGEFFELSGTCSWTLGG